MDKPRHPQLNSNRPQENKWSALPKREVRRQCSANVATPEQCRSRIPFGIPTGHLILSFLLTLLFVPGLAETGARQPAAPGSTMLEAARTFLATLDPAQNSKAVLPFNSEERFHWFYTPVSRKGIPLKELKASQRQAALALLRAGLSEKGYTKAETIRKLEGVLRELEGSSGPTR